MNRTFCFMPLLFFAALIGCASQPLIEAQEHFRNKDYDRAVAVWNPLAKDGNPYAQYGLGVAWEFGLGRTPKNLNQAAAWYLRAAKQNHVASMVRLAQIQKQLGHEEAALSWINLAARWNDATAIKILKELNLPIPRPDIHERHVAELQARKIEEQQALLAQQKKQQEAVDAFMNLLTLGVVAAGAARGGPQVAPPAAFNPLPVDIQTRSRGNTTTSGCTSDYECGYDRRCVKPPHSSSGVCHRAVDSYGTPIFSGPNPSSYGVRTDQGCISTADCPVTFRCDVTLKACFK